MSPTCPLCDAPRIPDGWRLLAFSPWADRRPTVDPWDAAELAVAAEASGCATAPYGTPLPEIAAESHGSLSDFLELAASAGYGLVATDSIILLLQAQHLCDVAAAQEAELEGVDGDALCALDASGLRALVVVAERLIADLERRTAALHVKERGRHVVPRYRELWQRQALTALTRAASAEQRAESAKYDNDRQDDELVWYQQSAP
jgi:hypothetical protein